MAAKIKFPLKMNGVDVRTLEELRLHNDAKSLLKYYENGKLTEWLEARYYNDEVERIKALDCHAPDFIRELSCVLGMEIPEGEQTGEEKGTGGISLSEIAVENQRLEQLKRFTSDDQILADIDHVAFFTEELNTLLNKKVSLIYLCGSEFYIPRYVEDVDAEIIGIGADKPVVKIRQEEYAGTTMLTGVSAVGGTTSGTDTADSTSPSSELTDIICRTSKSAQTFPKSESGYYNLTLKNVRISSDDLRELEEGEVVDSHKTHGLWLELAEDGDKDAQCELGKRYKNGIGTSKDPAKAFEWYQRAAEKEDAEAQYLVGECFEKGYGVKRNVQKAFEWYLKAAKQHHGKSQYLVGVCFKYGIGTQVNLEEARGWLKEAGESVELDGADIPYRDHRFSDAILEAIGGVDNLRIPAADDKPKTATSIDKESGQARVVVHNRRRTDEEILKNYGAKKIQIEKVTRAAIRTRDAKLGELFKGDSWYNSDGNLCEYRSAPYNCVIEYIQEDFGAGVVIMNFPFISLEMVEDFNENIKAKCMDGKAG